MLCRGKRVWYHARSGRSCTHTYRTDLVHMLTATDHVHMLTLITEVSTDSD